MQVRHRRELEKTLDRLVQAKKDQWQEFERYPSFYSISFILAQAKLIDGLIAETLRELAEDTVTQLRRA